MSGLTIANFAGELNIPVFWIMVVHYSSYPSITMTVNKILHKCQKISEDHMIIHISNDDIKAPF